MEFTRIKTSLNWIVFFLILACSNEQNISTKTEIESFPVINFGKDKRVTIQISDCIDDFKGNSDGITILDSKIVNKDLKILIGSKLSCDYRNGAYLKGILTEERNLHLNIYQLGERLSNECFCYFYYELTIKNKSIFPEVIIIGNQKVNFDYRGSMNNEDLSDVKNSLNQ